MRWTIRRKLALSISIPLLLTYSLVLAWDYQRQRQAATEFMQEMMLTRAKLSVGVIAARLEQSEDLASAIAAGAASGTRPAGGGNVLSALKRSVWPTVGLVVMADGTGVMTRLSEAGHLSELPPDFKASAAPWFGAVLQSGTPAWFAPVKAPGIAGGELCIYATPIRVGSEIRGVAAVVVPAERFREAGRPISAALSTSASSRRLSFESLVSEQLSDFAVVTGAGQVICSPQQLSTFEDIANHPDQHAEVVQAFLAASAGESRIALLRNMRVSDNADREDYWSVFIPVPATGWVFTTAVSESAVMRPVLLLMAERAGLLLAGALVMLLVVYLVAVRLLVPIERLAIAARKVGEGDLNTTAGGTAGSDELAQLARGFNAMVGRIKQQIEDIRRAAIAQEKVEGELRIARTIQADLLPRVFPPFPERTEFDLHAINVPAEHVAGDFYDFFFVGQNRLMLVVADVSGKGVPAAILMAVARTIVRNLAIAGLPPVQIARQLNHMLVEDSPENMFLTMFLGEYDPGTGVLQYVNAGHPEPLLVGRHDGRDEVREVGGSTAPLIGASDVWPEDAWEAEKVTLRPGESIVIYTDGFTEAHASPGELLGDERAMSIVGQCAGKTAAECCDHVSKAIEEFAGSTLSDDLTLLVLRRV